MDDFERRAEDISVDHPDVVQHYRAAHDISLRLEDDERLRAGSTTSRPSTEDLRQGLVHYRALFHGAARARRGPADEGSRHRLSARVRARSAVASVCDAGAVARRFVLHLDLDEFIAAVERLRHPELEGKPIVVGGDGDPSKRGVVSTASYEARAFGIRSAMPLRTAYKRNPDAIFLPVDADAYLAASRRGHGHAPHVRRRGRGRGVGRGVPGRRRPRTPRRSRARSRSGCSNARACGARSGSATTGSRPSSRAGSASRAACSCSPRTDGTRRCSACPPPSCGASGPRPRPSSPTSGSAPSGSSPTADEAALAERFGPSTGPWLASLGRGEGSASVHPEGWTRQGSEPGAHVPARPHRSGRGRGPRSPGPRARSRAISAGTSGSPPAWWSRCGSRPSSRAPTASRSPSPPRTPTRWPRPPLARSSGSTSTGPFGCVGVRAEMTPPVVQDGA